MASELKCCDLFSRKTALLQADQLVILEHGLLSDRVRRIGFDRVESVAMSRGVPWAGLLLIGLGIIGGGVPLLLIGLSQSTANSQLPMLLIGSVLLILGGPVFVWHAVCGQSRIYFVRSGETRELRAISPPRKIRRFLDEVLAAIESVQHRADGVGERGSAEQTLAESSDKTNAAPSREGSREAGPSDRH